MKIRPERVAQMIHREVADILERRLRDPGLSHWVNITGVDVNHDLSLARIYVTMLNDGAERERTLAALERASGFVRHELASRLGLREVPEVRFKLDESVERGARVDELLRRLETGEPLPDEPDEPDGESA
jgi:ribosome-binding factor A